MIIKYKLKDEVIALLNDRRYEILAAKYQSNYGCNI